jgi:uncharacterized SAM-binding protein YcdF (DUF218 family)
MSTGERSLCGRYGLRPVLPLERGFGVPIAATPPDEVPHRSWGRRQQLLVAFGLLVSIVLALVFVRTFVTPTWDGPADAGPIVVLGGSADERARLGIELAEGPPRRDVILSADAAKHAERYGRDCEEVDTHCVVPRPLSTWGEAQLVAELARGRDWPAVTVVTSEFHVPRSRMIFQRCVDVRVAMVGADTYGDRVPLRLALTEAFATAVSWSLHRDC